MGRRNSPDLEIRINDPAEARIFIQQFDWESIGQPCPKYVVYGVDQKISLIEVERLSDSDAVMAAKCILYDVLIPSTRREAYLEESFH